MGTIRHEFIPSNTLSHSIGKIIEVKWGNIVGDINKQKDLAEYIETILLNYPTIEEFTKDLDKKVDKIEGYGLSKNDFTDTLKALYDDAVVKSHIHQNKAVLDSISGFKTINGEVIIGEGNIEIKVEGVEEAPKDGKQYARQNGDWTEVKGGSEKPEGGWQKDDLSEDVQDSLNKADSAVQPLTDEEKGIEIYDGTKKRLNISNTKPFLAYSNEDVVYDEIVFEISNLKPKVYYPLIFPFDLTQAQIQESFGNVFQILYVNNVDINNVDGENKLLITTTKINNSGINNGVGVKAGTPFLINADGKDSNGTDLPWVTTHKIVFKNAKVIGNVTPNSYNLDTFGKYFYIVGGFCYSKIFGGDYYISTSNGDWTRLADGKTANLNPYKWALHSLYGYSNLTLKTNYYNYPNIFTQVQNITNGLDNKADKSDTYTKEEVDALVTPNTPNIIKFGDLDVTDGQMSNFSSTNYAQFPFLVDLTDEVFEITMQITTSADVTTQQNILDSQDGLAFAVRNGQLVLAVSNNGTQWAFEAVGGTIAANTTYLIKLGWNKSVYSVNYSTDNGATWVEAISQNSTLSPYPRTMLIGKDTTDRYIFKGSINLNKCTLSINGQYVWDGMTDAGLLTRLDTSLSNIDANGVDYINNLIDAKIGDIDNALKYILGDE